MNHTTGACEPNNGTMPQWVQALMPVRNLPTNNGSRIRKCVYDALEKGAPVWARRRLEYSLSKEVYKANACGPTKRAILSMLDDVSESVCLHSQKETRKKHVLCVPDITSKLCRIVLRQMAFLVYSFCKEYRMTFPDAAVFLNEVFDYLDFRTIDRKLAVGAYGGLHEPFLLDMKELWNNVRTAHAKRPNVVEFIATLSKHFQSIFEKEVLDPVRKLKVCAESNILIEEAEREVGNVLMSSRKMPKAPWNFGLCKACNSDKDDANILLCVVCDGEYHTYCLPIPLGTLPEGNWYCPLCVSSDNPTLNVPQLPGRRKNEKYQGNGESEKLGCTGAELEGTEDPETSSEDQIWSSVCKICGDMGFPEAGINCCKCKASFVHRRCMLEESHKFDKDVTWACEDCVPSVLEHCLAPIAIEAARSSAKPKKPQETCSDIQNDGRKSEHGTSFRSAKEKGKMRATEFQTGGTAARKKGGSRVLVQPIPHPIWKGSLSMSISNSVGQVEGVLMHLSNKASAKVHEELFPLPTSLPVEVLPRTSIWPPRFLSTQPSVRDIDIYLLQEEGRIDGVAFEAFINHIIVKDLAIRLVVKNGELLIFTCTQLPFECWSKLRI